MILQTAFFKLLTSVDFCSFSAAGRLVFENYLRTEYNDENLLFWLACENYKTHSGVTEMEVDATRIYKEFVQVDAPRQVWLFDREM